MKFQVVIPLIAAFVLFTGCKKETTGGTTLGTAVNFIVKVDFVAEQDDKFSLYYTNDGSIDFSENDPLWKDIKGRKTVQQVAYELPKDVVNPQIRLDFGNNPQQDKVIIEKISVSYGNNIFVVTGRHIFNYFRPDPAKCTVDLDDNAIVPKRDKGGRQTLSLYPRQEILAKEMLKLTANNDTE